MSKYYNGQKPPIVADFSMSGMEAEFAKGERKMSKAKMAAIGAAGVGTVGAGVAAAPSVKTAAKVYKRGKGMGMKTGDAMQAAGNAFAGSMKKRGMKSAKAAKSGIGGALSKIGKLVKRAK